MTEDSKNNKYDCNVFHKFQHLVRVGTKNVRGLFDGVCEIYPKLDGTNASIWKDVNGVIKMGSRTRELSTDKDNAGFCAWGAGEKRFDYFFDKYSNYRLYGEWLVLHTIKGYEPTSLRKFYVFDVLNENGDYETYEEYLPKLVEFGIDYIPIIKSIDHPSLEELNSIAKSCNYLMKPGYGIGEGIVVKRKDFVNYAGDTVWGKIVVSEFKDKRSVKDETKTTEEKIVDKYITSSLVDKTFAKLTLNNAWSTKRIGELLKEIYDEFIREESYNFIMENISSTIDFKTLKSLTYMEIKKIRSDIFI